MWNFYKMLTTAAFAFSYVLLGNCFWIYGCVCVYMCMCAFIRSNCAIFKDKAFKKKIGGGDKEAWKMNWF